MEMRPFGLYLIALLAFSSVDSASTSPTLTLSPATLTFSYLIGGTLPAAQSVAISGTTPLTFTTAVTQPTACSGSCVIVSANSGTTPANLQVYANPTGLAAGTYTATITINAPGAATPIQSVTVTIEVGDPQSSLSASTNSLQFSYTTGNPVTTQSAPVTLTTTGDALTASVVVAGGTWLKASPTGSIALAGLPQTVTVTVNAAGMIPAATPYKGTVTINSSNAANKSVVINVTLTVSAGIPTIAATNGIWPPGVPAGTTTPVTVTINGTNFTSASTASSGSTALTNITVVNSTTMLATIPSLLLATKGTLPIVITTPTASSPSTPASFAVYDPTVPQIWAVVNSASYNAGVVSPGEIITIYGAALGPTGVTPFSGGSLPTSLGVSGANTSVSIGGHAAPLLYTSPTQLSCLVPLAVTPGSANGGKVSVAVTYNGVTSATPFQVNVAAADPGVFTLGPSGQAAVLNINTSVTPNDYTVNGVTNPTHIGSWIAIYATGFGLTSCTNATNSPCSSPQPTESQFEGGGLVTPVGPLAVTIGGQAVSAPVGVVPTGSVIGLLQINAQVPATVTAGNAVPVVVSIGGSNSVGVATIVVK